MAENRRQLRQSTILNSLKSRKNTNNDDDNMKEMNLFVMENLKDELQNIHQETKRPTELYNDRDVDGKEMCPFQTPGKPDSIIQKAKSCRSSSKFQTPAPSSMNSIVPIKSELKVVLQKLPLQDSTKIINQWAIKKKSAEKYSKYSSSSESISEDEYKPNESDEDSEDDSFKEDDDLENEEDETSGDDFEKKPKSEMKNVLRSFSKSSTISKVKNDDFSTAYNEHHFETDDYFDSQSRKILTSNRTLNRLKNPRMDREKIQQLLKNQNYLSEEHISCIRRLSDKYRDMFPMWHFILEEGFSLLLYGLGSKRNLIIDFYEEIISEHPAVVVNGFDPGLNVKEILDGITIKLLGLESIVNLDECFKTIDSVLRSNPADRLYLIIHNIDGPQLRTSRMQDFFSQLATIPNFHIIASIDHINSSTLWDNVKRTRFNFFFCDTTTFLPYEKETVFGDSMLVEKSGQLVLSSLQSVFPSLNSNAKKIYIILIKYQLENGYRVNYPGMAFTNLLRVTREEFLVNSDMALRLQLTEFIDHELVKQKRNIEGIEHLIIPLEKEFLEQFLEQQQET